MFKKDFRTHYVISILVIGAVLVVGLLFLRSHHRALVAAVVSDSIYNKTLTAGSLTIPVSVADTEAAREQGLSDTASLPAQAGKLFVFQAPGMPGFWMKDMEYGLDFVWFDSNLKIVSITTDVAANTYPKIFYPSQPVLYVLEVNAGFSAQHNLAVGEQFTLQ
jgi:uncharacterized membrane protein (UPF0127 family)